MNLTGQKFNRLTVIEFAGRSKYGASKYKCKCECGNLSSVRGWELKNNIVIKQYISRLMWLLYK